MNIKSSNSYKTILTICIGFLVLFFFTDLKIFLSISLAVGIIALVSEFISKQIEFIWIKLAWVLSLIMPNILLSVIFYIILFPIALLSKLFSKKDPLMLKNNYSSMFKVTNKTFDKKSFENPW